jgi:two-component system sensor histidine kinase KdpD
MDPAARTALRVVVAVAVALTTATAAVAVLEDAFGVANASPVYLVAVVLVALLAGTAGAVVTAVGAAILYNFLFTEPRFTLAVADPGILLSLVVLLFVGIVVGQLAAVQRERAETAAVREREARALFGVSRALATRGSMDEALAGILEALRAEAALERAWFGIGPEASSERIAADTGGGRPPAPSVRVRVLQRMPGDQASRWTLVQPPAAGPRRAASTGDLYRVRIEASLEPLGSLWAIRRRGSGAPDQTQTRLLAAAADQVGQAVTHDRSADQARAAEVARQSDALKSALLQSVSHDLRTPLATIRAAAGGLRPDSPLDDGARRAGADSIEREVAYLDRLVTNLLDLSRIEAGALRPRREVFDLDDLLARSLDQTRGRLETRRLEVDLASSPVHADPVFVDEAVANVLDNAVKYASGGTRIVVAARDAMLDRVRLTIEDDGPGVADDALPRVWDRFYRHPEPGRRSSRDGIGIGLAVARGLLEATGGSVAARRSDLGGLAIDIDLPAHVAAAPMAADDGL